MEKISIFKGEILSINLDPTTGAEIQKTRPADIASKDAMGVLPLRIIVPLTDWKEHYSAALWIISIKPDEDNNLVKPSAADVFQIHPVSQDRFVCRIGAVTKEQLTQIVEAIQIIIGAI